MVKINLQLTEGTTRAMCWVHARRYFYYSLPSKKNLDPDLIPVQALNRIRQLFVKEKEFANANPEKKKEIWEEDGVASKKCCEAIEYSLKHEEELRAFERDVRIPLTNSLAERTIRPFAVERKN